MLVEELAAKRRSVQLVSARRGRLPQGRRETGRCVFLKSALPRLSLRFHPEAGPFGEDFMRETIQQFMWGYQPHFRYSLEAVARHALQSIGIHAAPEALLIGFLEEGEARWPICIEPQNRGFDPSVLDDIVADAERRLDDHPDAGVFYSDADSNERMEITRLEDCRRDAIAAALEASAPGDGRLFFIGYPRRVANYRVYPVVSVIRAVWVRLPRLAHEQRHGRLVTIASLQHAVIQEVLRTATADLDRQKPPRDMSDWPHVLAGDAIRRGAERFLHSLVVVHGSWEGTEFMGAMDAVAAQPYEGRTALGSLLLAKPEHPSLTYDLRFRPPLQARKSRVFRKTLEMSDVSVALIADGAEIVGLGRLLDTYDPDTETVYDVAVVARGAWELSHNGVGLMRVENGRAQLPQERIARDVFIDTATRVLGDGADPQKLWAQVEGAAEQQHGTMLVVHRDADAEAVRLGAQATLIDPTELSAEALASVTSIDGAILLRPDATCVAVGVILDGIAGPGVGDPARGARYNSGRRYQAGATQGCLVVIVSEDGMIDLVPKLPRRVKRSEVEQALQRLEESADATDVDFEVATNRGDHVVSLAFYLTAEQCARYNVARTRIERARARSGSGIEIGWRRLQPDLALDDSYFLPE